MSFLDYYYRNGETPDPVVLVIIVGILVLTFVGLYFYNHIQGKKKGDI